MSAKPETVLGTNPSPDRGIFLCGSHLPLVHVGPRPGCDVTLSGVVVVTTHSFFDLPLLSGGFISSRAELQRPLHTLRFTRNQAGTSLLFHAAPHNRAAAGYLQYAIPKGFGAAQTGIQSVSLRRNHDLCGPCRLFHFGNKCHGGICHTFCLES